VGGARWAVPAPAAKSVFQRARATADGVTAKLARRTPRAARPRSRGSAALRPTCHQANARERLARRSSRPEHTVHSGGPAPGVAGGRGDDLARAQQTKRSAVREQRVSSSSGTVGRGHATDIRDRDPWPREGPPSSPRPRSGLCRVARGMEAHQGSRRTAARCAARQPDPAHHGRASHLPPTRGRSSRHRTTNRRVKSSASP
jgi:hypothetical protein